jgi:hypothetical protein
MQTSGSQPKAEGVPVPVPVPVLGDDGKAGGGQDALWPLVETIESTLLGISLAILGIAPRAGAFVLCALAIATSIEAIRSWPPWTFRRSVMAEILSSPAVALFALIGWACISATWASEPAFTVTSVGQIAAIVAGAGVTGYLLPAQMAALPPQRRRRFVRAVLLGFLIGLSFVAVEFVSANAVSHLLFARFPRLMGDNAKDFVRDGGKLLGFLPFYLDRNVAALTLGLPGVAVALRYYLPPDRSAWGIALALGAAVVVIAFSWSGAAKLAAVAGLVAAAAWSWRPGEARLILQALLIAGIVLAVPIAELPVKLGLDQGAALPPSARERIAIWGHTAAAVREAPLRGIGAQSTRFMSAQERMRVEGVTGERRALGWHSHNVVLQTWLELGAIGAGLLLWTLLAFVRAIGRWDERMQPAGAALIVMVMAIAVTGWGMWQPWLVAAIGIASVGLVLVPAGRGNRIH